MRIRHCLDYVVVNFLLRFLNVCNLIVIKIHSSIYKYIYLFIYLDNFIWPDDGRFVDRNVANKIFYSNYIDSF